MEVASEKEASWYVLITCTGNYGTGKVVRSEFSIHRHHTSYSYFSAILGSLSLVLGACCFSNLSIIHIDLSFHENGTLPKIDYYILVWSVRLNIGKHQLPKSAQAL